MKLILKMEIFQLLSAFVLFLGIQGRSSLLTKRESEVRPMKLSWVPLIEPTDLANAQSLMIGIQPLNEVMEENINAANEQKHNPRLRPPMFEYDEQPEGNSHHKKKKRPSNNKGRNNQFYDDYDSTNDEIYVPRHDDTSIEEAANSDSENEKDVVHLDTSYDKLMARYRAVPPYDIFFKPDRHMSNSQKKKKIHEDSHEHDDDDENLPEELVPLHQFDSPAYRKFQKHIEEEFMPAKEEPQGRRAPAKRKPQGRRGPANDDDEEEEEEDHQSPSYDYDALPVAHENEQSNSGESTNPDYDNAPLEEFVGTYDSENTEKENVQNFPNEKTNQIRREFRERENAPIPEPLPQQPSPVVKNRPTQKEQSTGHFERTTGKHSDHIPVVENQDSFLQVPVPQKVATSPKFRNEQLPVTESVSFPSNHKNQENNFQVNTRPQEFIQNTQPSDIRNLPISLETEEQFNTNENTGVHSNKNLMLQQEKPIPRRQFIEQRELPQNFRPIVANTNDQQKQFLTSAPVQKISQTFPSVATTNDQQRAFENPEQHTVQRPVNLKKVQFHDDESFQPKNFHINSPDNSQNFRESQQPLVERQINVFSTARAIPKTTNNANFAESGNQNLQARSNNQRRNNYQEVSRSNPDSRRQFHSNIQSEASVPNEQASQQRRVSNKHGLGVGIGFLADIEEPLKQMFLEARNAKP